MIDVILTRAIASNFQLRDDLEEIILIPTSFEAFVLDAEFGC